ncbi:MAG: phosphatidate cytidylyltransferase [Actinomycetota bacterium]
MSATFPSSTASERPASALPLAIGGVLGFLAVLASWAGRVPFVIFVVAVAGLVAMELTAVASRRQMRPNGALLIPAAAVAPLVAFRWGEAGLGVSAGLITPVILGLFLIGGVRPKVLDSMAATIFGFLYIGLLGSYSVLLRNLRPGHRLVVALILMVAGYHLGRWAGAARLPGPTVVPALRNSTTWGGVAGGVVGSVVFSLLAALVVPIESGPVSMLLLGLIVGLAAAGGDLAWLLVMGEMGIGPREAAVPGLGGLLARTSTILVAAPACFYGFKLYLV